MAKINDGRADGVSADDLESERIEKQLRFANRRDLAFKQPLPYGEASVLQSVLVFRLGNHDSGIGKQIDIVDMVEMAVRDENG